MAKNESINDAASEALANQQEMLDRLIYRTHFPENQRRVPNELSGMSLADRWQMYDQAPKTPAPVVEIISSPELPVIRTARTDAIDNLSWVLDQIAMLIEGTILRKKRVPDFVTKFKPADLETRVICQTERLWEIICPENILLNAKRFWNSISRDKHQRVEI